jgi:hypothetical protein
MTSGGPEIRRLRLDTAAITLSARADDPVLDQADDDLNDQSGDAAADELAGKGADVHATCSAANPQDRVQNGITANATYRAGNQISDIAEVGVLDELSARSATNGTTDELRKYG